MQAILAVTVPFFALVLLGWIAARAGPLPESAIPGLNAYVLFFALPCMLFRFGAGLPLARLADPVLLGIYLAARRADGRADDRGHGADDAPAAAASACAMPPSAPWWRRSRTPASWACRCWWRCSATPPPAR